MSTLAASGIGGSWTLNAQLPTLKMQGLVLRGDCDEEFLNGPLP